MQQSTEQIKADLHEQTGELKAHGQQVAAGIGADVAQQSRILLRAVSAELPDCPRLFTLVPRQAGGWQRVKLWQDSFRITLWCEHPGAEHPWPAAQYDFGRPKQWLATVAPYVVVVSRLLQALVPVGERRSASPLSEQELKAVKGELDLMKALVDRLPQETAERYSIEVVGGELKAAQGGELRAVRALLVTLDPTMSFGDLRRVVAPSGDLSLGVPQHPLPRVRPRTAPPTLTGSGLAVR